MGAFEECVGVGDGLWGKIELPLVVVGEVEGDEAFGKEVDNGPLVDGGVGVAGGFEGLAVIVADFDFVLAVP